MLIAILFIAAIALFLIDAFTRSSAYFPRVNKTAMGLACMAAALLILSGKLHELL